MDALYGGDRWDVLLTARADGQLRALKRDQKVFKIVHNRIHELSSGEFNWNNHRPVIGSTKYIPIYRAKLPFDLRIIYQISVEPYDEAMHDRQVILILRIESRAHVDYQFWVKVSRCLAIEKGPEYRRRCIYRWDSYLPAKFPPSTYRNPKKSGSVGYEGVRSKEGMECN
ncbi:hypothetical protein FRC08_015452 [Ceratobasidium sp. 394]|nr:hypothetical protein FRC08_015452 [Ceratobasidium sp. 394]